MDSNQNKLMVMQGYEHYQRGDIKSLLGNCSDDIEIVSSDNEHIPFTGHYRGLHEAADYFATLGGAVETLHFAPKHFVAEGDKVVVTGEARWQAKSTGADWHSPWVHVFTFKDGKISRFEQYSNSAAAEAAFKMPKMSAEELAAMRH